MQGPSENVHYGVKYSLTDLFEGNTFPEKTIRINVNVDGLLLYKSSKQQVWPILVNIHNTSSVFVAGA